MAGAGSEGSNNLVAVLIPALAAIVVAAIAAGIGPFEKQEDNPEPEPTSSPSPGPIPTYPPAPLPSVPSNPPTIIPPILALPDFAAVPLYGELELAAGFPDDPQIVALTAGGTLSAGAIGDQCLGFIGSAPDVRVNYEAAERPLIFSVAAEADTTLVVKAADGYWYCDDDGGEEPLNPSLWFDSPMSGRYEVWIGAIASDETPPANLHISELGSQ